MQEEVKQNRPYKIMVGDIITIYRRDFDYNGKTIVNYSTPIKKIEYDKTVNFYYKNIKFKSGTMLDNKTSIKINNMFEDVTKNKKDPYNPVWSLFILDYEIVEKSSNENISEFNKKIKEDFGETVELSPEDLPF